MACLRYLPKLLVFSAIGMLSGSVWADEGPASGPVTLADHIKPVLQQYCFDCHNAEKQKGDVNLVEISKNANLQANREIWEKVVSSVEAGDMPPEKKPQPSGQQRDLLLHFVDGQLSKLDCTTEKNPGRVTLRRLNREEYRHTIFDLLRVNFDPQDFPNDEVGYGFDNIADVLSVSPMLMEKYMDAAEEVAKRTIVTAVDKPVIKHVKGSEFQGLKAEAGSPTEGGSLAFMREGEATHAIEFPAKGEYKIRIRATGDQAGTEPPKMAVRLGDKTLGVVDVGAKGSKSSVYQLIAKVEQPGWNKLAIAYTNNYSDQDNPDPKLRGDRNLYVESVDVEFPPGEAALPESHRSIIPTLPAAGEERAAARKYLAPLLRRAYRRPVDGEEVERIAKFVDLALDHKGTFTEGMQVALEAILSSPQFLFRWELDVARGKPGEVRELSDFEVASRLSYFLWSSMPDEELFQLADKGALRKDGNLEKQIARMLKDWRARSLVNNFADQWLQIRNIYEVSPDPQTFPKWNDELRGLMKEETERYFEAIMQEDRSVSDLLDSDFTFLNEKLAKYYGIEGVSGNEFRKVQLPANSPRGGVMTQGAVLLATSTPTRTSPVIRGKWIMEQILGTPPPAPPANVPPLTEQKVVDQSASLRQRFTEHSQKAECAACHRLMDPLGFALENFDAIGSWREKDGKFPIDASGKLKDGRKFKDAKELKAALKSGDQFVSTFAEKLMTYALGRGLDFNDRCAVKTVVDQAKSQDNRFSALVMGIVTSDPFLKRKISEDLTKN